MTTSIILILIGICIILSYQLSKKIKVDNSIYQQNEELKKEQVQLEQKHSKLLVETTLQENALQNLEKQKENAFNELNKLHNNIANSLNENKQISDSAFQEYEKTLEQAYIEVELSFDKKAGKLWNEMDSIQK